MAKEKRKKAHHSVHDSGKRGPSFESNSLKQQGRIEGSPWRMEVDDLLGGAILGAWILFGWIAFLKWNPDLSITQHDGLFMALPHLLDLKEQAGDVLQMLYRAELQGGAKIYGPSGMMVGHALFSKLGLGVVAVSNLSLFLIQFLVAFLGVRATLDFSKVYLREKIISPIFSWSILSPLFAFLPVLGWRLTYGHESMICGSLFFVAVLSGLLALAAERLSAVHFLVMVLGGLHSFSNSGQQMVVYSAVFGAPILGAVWWSAIWRSESPSVRARRALYTGFPFFLLILCLGLAIQPFTAMLKHAASLDSPREFGKASLTFSYITATALDWLTSIPWSKAWVGDARSEGIYHHEINYALGPLLLTGLIFPWRRWWVLGVGFFSSALIAALFSMNFSLVSTPLLTLIPPLNLFRVPERAIIPFVLVFPIIAVSALFNQWKNHLRREVDPTSISNWLRVVGVGLVGVLAWLLPPLATEILVWGMVAFACFGLGGASRATRGLGLEIALGLLLAIGLVEIHAFGERIAGYANRQSIELQPAQLREQILIQQPELKAPLVRSAFHFNLGGFHVNTSYALGIGSLSAYWFPNRRYLKLLSGLEGSDFPPASHYLEVAGLKGYSILRQLYHQKYDVRFVQNRIVVEPWNTPTLGSAWFSAGLRSFASYGELASWLYGLGSPLAEKVRMESGWVAEDPYFARAPVGVRSLTGCQEARVLGLDGERFRSAWSARVQVPNGSDCPLTLAMNYSEILKAEVRTGSGEWRPAEVFPILGALAGIWVPGSSTEVRVRPVFELPIWAQIYRAISILLVLGIVGLAFWRGLSKGKGIGLPDAGASSSV